MPKADTHPTPAEFESLLATLHGGVHALRHLAASAGVVEPEALVFVADGLQRVADELAAVLSISSSSA